MYQYLDDRRVRIHGRRTLIDPCITKELKQDFKLESYQRESNEVLRNDLEGTYEILIEEKLVVLRFLNFIPYLDIDNNIPSGYTFFVKLFNNGNEIESHLPVEIKVDRKSVFGLRWNMYCPIPRKYNGLECVEYVRYNKKE